MLRSSRSKWVSGIGAVVLSGGLLVAGYGTGILPAEATITFVNPFPIIIDKLNQILAKLSTSGGGGGNHTLRWNSNLTGTTRFTTAFPGAVLDNNTGLVWEQAPDATPRIWQSIADSPGATNYCVNKNVGGTRGWRLPSVAELASLVDPTLSAPFVPGTVFTGVQSASYWSATTNERLPDTAWLVEFFNGNVFFNGKGGAIPRAWCVRGGNSGADAY